MPSRVVQRDWLSSDIGGQTAFGLVEYFEPVALRILQIKRCAAVAVVMHRAAGVSLRLQMLAHLLHFGAVLQVKGGVGEGASGMDL